MTEMTTLDWPNRSMAGKAFNRIAFVKLFEKVQLDEPEVSKML